MDTWKKYGASLDEYETMRDDMIANAENAAVPDALMMKLEVGFEEAVVNVINYSGSENIWIKTGAGDNLFTVELVDCGAPFNPLVVNDPRASDDSPIEEREPGGFGIFLIKETFDELHYAFEDFDGQPANHLSLSLRLDRDES